MHQHARIDKKDIQPPELLRHPGGQPFYILNFSLIRHQGCDAQLGRRLLDSLFLLPVMITVSPWSFKTFAVA